MSRTAIKINLDTTEQALLHKILRKLSIPEFQKERVQIVLAASTGLQNNDITKQYKLEKIVSANGANPLVVSAIIFYNGQLLLVVGLKEKKMVTTIFRIVSIDC